jgi:hypothetical protein
MKRLAALVWACGLIAVTPSASLSQKPLGEAHQEDVKRVMSVNTIDPNGVQIIVAVGDGSQLVLEMDSTTAHSMAAQIRSLESQPRGAP